METVYVGKVWKFGDKISTDFMVPGAKVLANPDISPEEAASYCMMANRPDWAAQVRSGDILVGGVNFGCGSSRNGSGPLKILGITCVLAESISRIHLRNAVNTGLPTLVAPGIASFVEEGQKLRVDIVSGEVKNLDTGKTLMAQGWATDSPPFQILMAGGLDPFMKKKLRETGLVKA